MIKITQSVKPNSFRWVENRHSTAGDRSEHFFPNVLITTPPMLDQLFFDFEEGFWFELSFVQFLSEENQKFRVFAFIRNYEGICLVDDHATLSEDRHTLILSASLIYCTNYITSSGWICQYFEFNYHWADISCSKVMFLLFSSLKRPIYLRTRSR